MKVIKMYLLKIFKKIVISIIIFVICGISYNFFVDAYHRIMSSDGENKVYLITIYNNDVLTSTDTSYKEPEINENYIKYTDLNGNVKYYNNFKISIIQTTEDNNNL